VICVLPLLSCGLIFGSLAQSPEQVVQSFVEALNKKDFTGAAKLVRAGSISPYLKSTLDKQTNTPVMNLSSMKSAIAGDHCIVSFHLETTSPPGIPPMDDYLVLVNATSGWLIDQPVRGDGLSLMAYFMSDPPLLRQAQAAAEATRCLSNIKQISTAILIFLADNNDVFKLTGANWRTKLAPYAKSAVMFTCPLDSQGTASYTFNANLAGKDATSLKFISETVLVYEGSAGKLDF